MRPSTALAQPPVPSRPATSPPPATHREEPPAYVRRIFSTWVTGATTTSQLRLALRLYCREARAQQMRPEEVLVAFKALCRSVPEACGPQRGDAKDDPIARAVTMCIEEYYGAAPAGTPAP